MEGSLKNARDVTAQVRLWNPQGICCHVRAGQCASRGRYVDVSLGWRVWARPWWYFQLLEVQLSL